jgi:solute carrier family 1 (neuronal/epithelial high affinity glutamate transporter), member 1
MNRAPQTEHPNGEPSQEKNHSGLRHTVYIVAAIILAVIFAFLFPRAAAMHLGGEIFLRVLMMIVVPLVVASVMSGILGLGDVRKLGRPGLYAIVYYLGTTVLAVSVGLVVVNLLKPGHSVSEEQLKASSAKSDKAVEFRKKRSP